MKVSFAAITLIEILGPLALLSPPFRRFYLVAMVGFHIGVALTMNIIFWENAVLLVFLLGGDVIPRRADLPSPTQNPEGAVLAS